MTALIKGLTVAAVQLALVSSLGAKLLYDRATRPRVWARAAPYDPNLPIRGRYLSLQLAVETRGVVAPPSGATFQPPQAVTLKIASDRLVADAAPQSADYDADDLHVIFVDRRGEKIAVLDQPIALFIPENIPDPSFRPEGEQLWVEVTVPRKGPPRPIQLGVKKGEGLIVPMEIR